MSRYLGVLVATLVSAAAVCVATPAAALPEIRDEVQRAAQMTCRPSCLLCHNSVLGGANQFRLTSTGAPGFGQTLRDKYDLLFSRVGTVAPALAADKAANSDIDFDGVNDVDELTAGTDPNDPNGVLCGDGAVTGPEFGCARVARGGDVGGVGSALAGLALVTGAAVLRRRVLRK